MKNRSLHELSKGIIKENPTFILVLGMCPTLAVSTTAKNSFMMGIAATAVLVLSNIIISLLRKLIPDTVRIPVYITVIAGFVTIVQLLMKAFLPELDKALGIYIPLIVVNCIILARAEAFAGKNNAWYSFLDGLGMGLGFTLALTVIGTIREFLGNGAIFGFKIIKNIPMPAIFVTPAGAFLVLGSLMALVSALTRKKTEIKDCADCPVQCETKDKKGESR
ncbi:MAG TPA: electron transport complex subunit E [Clostridia bacterium]|jgi:electron transport complex protein RnfE|nr:electron transport complex subunit E [Clostridiaceae bacterium]HOF26255.1 electron transport complex subunit E [Clostridia bacterium]HOM35033.1 electron transport complex subunit E [Clostridia bacterium]HOR89569.1 electron transport complex subunit E [Clostridia bacterium]HOT70025.1 electron transport complex subunit E [Clostridia bacterium]